MFAAEDVGEDEWFSQLTGVHEDARAVDGPWSFIHKKFHPSGEGCWYYLVVNGSVSQSVAQNVLRPIATARGWFS